MKDINQVKEDIKQEIEDCIYMDGLEDSKGNSYEYDPEEHRQELYEEGYKGVFEEIEFKDLYYECKDRVVG
jgi:hypothetical protein